MSYPDGYNYAANTHLFTMGGFNILLDVGSGAVHLVDEVAARFISCLINGGGIYQARMDCERLYGKDRTAEVESELIEAVHSGCLFTPDELPVVDTDGLRVKALCLNVAHLCNMRCRYCFARQGDFGAEKGLMTRDVGQRALDFLVEQSGDIRNLEVDFFGGEPLLNFEVVRELVSYGRSRSGKAGKKIRFTLTTNALLLDEDIMNFLVEEEISVILSLDGRKQVNDRYRVLADGQGSYDLILPRIQAMVAKRPISYYVRGTFSRANLDFARDAEHLISCGFTNISLEPAVGPYTDYTVGQDEIERVLAEYENLTGLIWSHHRQGRSINFFHFNLDLNRGPCLAKRVTGCGAGVEYLAVTPGGSIYPCHQFVGEKDFVMGNVYDSIVDSGIRARFANNQLANKEECRRCWARFYCGGGCAANAYFSTGHLGKPAPAGCAMHRKRIECGIYLDIMKRLANFGEANYINYFAL